MKHGSTILLLAACSLIAACGTRDFMLSDGQAGKITMQGDLLTLHADGQPDAWIGPSGDLTVGSNPVTVAPLQRGLLMMYYQNVLDMRTQSVAMGSATLKAGLQSLEHLAGGKSASSRVTKHDLEQKMCRDHASIKAMQDQLAAQVPAFKPYGNIVDNEDCGNGTKR